MTRVNCSAAASMDILLFPVLMRSYLFRSTNGDRKIILNTVWYFICRNILYQLSAGLLILLSLEYLAVLIEGPWQDWHADKHWRTSLLQNMPNAIPDPSASSARFLCRACDTSKMHWRIWLYYLHDDRSSYATSLDADKIFYIRCEGLFIYC